MLNYALLSLQLKPIVVLSDQNLLHTISYSDLTTLLLGNPLEYTLFKPVIVFLSPIAKLFTNPSSTLSSF
jgi:hypothetical protein